MNDMYGINALLAPFQGLNSSSCISHMALPYVVARTLSGCILQKNYCFKVEEAQGGLKRPSLKKTLRHRFDVSISLCLRMAGANKRNKNYDYRQTIVIALKGQNQ